MVLWLKWSSRLRFGAVFCRMRKARNDIILAAGAGCQAGQDRRRRFRAALDNAPRAPIKRLLNNELKLKPLSIHAAARKGSDE
jgi:hypothetical protein